MIDTREIKIHRWDEGGVSVVGATHRGVKRETNEDCFAVVPARRVVAVADGMGGHEHGEEAARRAVEAAVSDPVDGLDDEEFARAAAEAAQGAVAPMVRAWEGAGAPGCTLVVARLSHDGRRAALRWLGDSRAYLVHRGELTRLTADHANWLGQLMRCVGGVRGAPGQEVDDGQDASVELPPGAQILLCTDGIHGVLPDALMAAAINGASSRAEAVRALFVAATSGAGGARVSNDNLTALFIRASAPA